jgi:hypothetical protein
MLLPLCLFVFARNTEIKNGCKAKKTAAIKDLKASKNKDEDFKIYFPKLICSTRAYRIACTHLVLSGAAHIRSHFISPPTEQISDFCFASCTGLLWRRRSVNSSRIRCENRYALISAIRYSANGALISLQRHILPRHR